MSDNYYAFPDIHGCMDLLQKALDYVYNKNPDGGKIIFLGDYIDRGTNNKEVLYTVMTPPENWEFVCLMGNHEQMFLDSYHYKTQFYDPKPFLEFTDKDIYSMSVQELCDLIPSDIIDWMKALKLFHFEDMNVFAHAYYDPDVKPDEQREQLVLWDRMSDHEAYFSDTLFLTHGHTPRAHGPCKAPNRINLDCGGFYTGKYAIAEYRKDVKGPVDLHIFTDTSHLSDK